MLSASYKQLALRLLSPLVLSFCVLLAQESVGQTILYRMPASSAPHEGTWLQWPHNNLYGPWYMDDAEVTFLQMTAALQSNEKVHIIAYDEQAMEGIVGTLEEAGIPLENIDFYLQPTDDAWVRDNGPMFVFDENNNLCILDWGFNGWGQDAPFALCDQIPAFVGEQINVPTIDLNGMVLEGGAIEHDGNGTLFATRSSVTHPSRNPFLSEEQIEDSLTAYLGISQFIWLDGVYGMDITDQHIDAFVKFANDSTIVTMNEADLSYWYVSEEEQGQIYGANNVDGEAYNIVVLPLTAQNVITSYGVNLGYKGSYVNYYLGNEVALVPIYDDPNDPLALAILEDLHPDREVIGIDVRDIYAYGGMVHCLTQQQPEGLIETAVSSETLDSFMLGQNAPNPFHESTQVYLHFPHDKRASLEIRNSFGQLVDRVFLQKGQRNASLNAANLRSGVYVYTLLLEGVPVESKRMIVYK